MGNARGRRNLVLAVSAIAVAAVALVLVIVLSGDDDSKQQVSTQPATTGSTTTTTETSKKTKKKDGKGGKGTTGLTPAPGTPEQRERELTPNIRQRQGGAGLETIRVRDGVPVGGLLRLVYQRGNRVRLRILTDRSERVVIPTLGLAERGGPPSGVTFDFVAQESGLFGVELRRGGERTRVAVLVIH